jgi:hypothetical protein
LIAKEALSNVVITTKVVKKLCFTTKNLRLRFALAVRVLKLKIHNRLGESATEADNKIRVIFPATWIQ